MVRRGEPGPCSAFRGSVWGGLTGSLASALAFAVAGCGGGSHPPAVDAGPMGPEWWQPKVGEAKSWDIQLSGAIDVSTPRLMYVLDLWALVPSPMMLDYGDGDPVMVPAGAQAGMIAQLHARTPQTIVICHVETGMLELNRPDARKFPGGSQDPTKIPDNPDDAAPGVTVTGDPASGSVIGWSLGGMNGGTASKRFLDITEANRGNWAKFMWKRFDLAKQIGCDGIESAHNDVSSYTSGFVIPSTQSYTWYDEVAKQGHDRKLSTGMKNGDLLSGQVDREADKFDWLMTERCGEFDTCDTARPFINLGKAVFAIDYDHDSGDPPTPPAPQASTLVCMNQIKGMIADGIYKDVPLTKAVRTQCLP